MMLSDLCRFMTEQSAIGGLEFVALVHNGNRFLALMRKEAK